MAGWLNRLLGGAKTPPLPPSMTDEELLALVAPYRRRAIALDLAEAAPNTPAASSWHGRVCLAAPGEDWPRHEGRPMSPVCQINLTTLPFVPEVVADLALITLFIDPEAELYDEPNGRGWCLCAYRSLDGLVPLADPRHEEDFVVGLLAATVIEGDLPHDEDLPVELPDDMLDRYIDLGETTMLLKLGGWPQWVQGSLFVEEPEPITRALALEVAAHSDGWYMGDGSAYILRYPAGSEHGEWRLLTQIT